MCLYVIKLFFITTNDFVILVIKCNKMKHVIASNIYECYSENKLS